MTRAFSPSHVVRSLGGIALFLCALGIPAAKVSMRSGCPSSLATAQLGVKATGIERLGRWALISLKQDDVLVDEGGTIGGCFTLVRVRNNSVVVGLGRSGEQREYFFGGISSEPVVEKVKSVPPGDAFMKAVEGYQVVPLASNISKIHYPPYSNNNTLPQTVYRNDRGEALYDDYVSIGLGEDPLPQDPASGVEGVKIGKNTDDSIFGSLGLTQGDHLVAINGRFVTTPEEVGRLLKEFSGEPLQIGYTHGDDSAVYSTATMIKTG